MKLKLLRGTTSKLLRVFIQDSTKTDGSGLTGLTSGSSGLTCYYCYEGANAATSVSLSGGTLGTWSSGGFIVVDGTNMPGIYEVGIPNAAIATGNSVVVMLKGATNMVPVLLEIELDAVAYQSATNFGLSCLPTAAAAASNGLLTFGSGSGQLSPSSGAMPVFGDLTSTMKTSVTTAATAATPTVVVGSYSAAQDPATLVLDVAASGHNTAGTIGAKINASGSSTDPLTNAASTYATPGTVGYYLAHSLSNTGAAVVSNSDKTGYSLTGGQPANFSSMLITAGGAVTAGTVSDKTGYALVSTEHTQITADVLNATAASYNTVGSIGAKINAAGSSSDPLANATSVYATPGTVGYILGHSLGGTGATVATNNDKTGYSLNLAQAVPTSNTVQSVGDALNAARAGAFGSIAVVGTTMTVYAGDGSAARVFTLDNPSAPTQRT